MDRSSAQPDVDELAIEYLRLAEVGQAPDLAKLAARLPDETSREELRAIVDTAAWARSKFPVPFRPQTVVAERYLLLEELGAGGFGKVWRAKDQKLGRDVALKLFHPLMEDAQLESTLRRERDSLARVHHDGIVRLLDSGRHEDTHFLAMEFVPGNTLDKVLAVLAAQSPEGPPGRVAVAAAIGERPSAGEDSLLDDTWYRTAVHITVGILRALAAAHGNQIFHRDLKPGNVLLRPGGRPVLLDFGLAGLGDLAQGTLTGRLFGTAAYMAPEQLAKMRTGKDARTDLYQCGLLLYEMLTFRRAFADSDRNSVLEAVRRGMVACPRQVRRDVPSELDDICMRALERNPDHRYATADAFREDLERWLAGSLPSVSRLGVAGRAWRRARRFTVSHRTAVSVAMLVLAGAGSTTWFALRPESVVATARGDGSYDVTTRCRGKVCAWLTCLDVDGRSLGTYPLGIQVGDQRPELQVELDGGNSTVRIVEGVDYDRVPGTVRTEVRWFLASDREAADWMSLIQRVYEEARRREKVVENGRVREIATELLAAGKGAGGIGALPIDDLLR